MVGQSVTVYCMNLSLTSLLCIVELVHCPCVSVVNVGVEILMGFHATVRIFYIVKSRLVLHVCHVIFSMTILLLLPLLDLCCPMSVHCQCHSVYKSDMSCKLNSKLCNMPFLLA